MEKYVITTGKTLDLAIAAALEQLQMDRTNVSVEVLKQPKSGFLGIGAQPAEVKVTYDDGVKEAPAAALSSASRSKPKPPKRPKPEQPKAPEPERTAPEMPREAKDAPRAQKPQRGPRPPKGEAPRAPKPQRPAPEPKEYPAAAPGSTEERIEVFLKGLLEHMGSDAVPHARKSEEDSYTVELVGASLGMLIGHRGETLDAIQHLTNYVINRGAAKRVRVNVDAENYRLKREESLQRLAKKVAGKVVRFHRNITLEPMNAYERHVIHAALQDVPDVTTFSTGTEPNRRVVVAYSCEAEPIPRTPKREEAPAVGEAPELETVPGTGPEEEPAEQTEE